MCEQTEINYLDGEVVWVKLGSCWWPGEVIAPEKLPPDVLPSFRKPPIAVVKFFQEDTYEYVKNINSIYKYNCSRKNEFINKGLYMFRTKHGHMEKFPDDIIRAETAIGGDLQILTKDEFQEAKKESYAGLFGDPGKKTPASIKKGKSGRGKSTESPRISTPIRKINKEKNDYKVHILVQQSKTTPHAENEPSDVTLTPSTSFIDTENSAENTPQNVEKSVSTISTPSASSSGIYSCHACSFTTTRLNVLILHNKTHSVTFTPYTPSPVRKKLTTKLPTKSTPISSKTPKARRSRKENPEKSRKKSQSKKRATEEQSSSTEAKKIKTDEEIKSSLLADWDDVDDESNDESSTINMPQSPEVPIAAESPAVPTPAELPSAQVPSDILYLTADKKPSSPASEKPETSNDSKYEFCEDEDWPLEADVGRKIPRVKNPKRKEDTKSLSLDEDDMAREVAELLNKTTVPELPAAPEPLKVEENFPEPSIVKSPDKTREKSPEKILEKQATEVQPIKAIFKTKTFFRSRHSRSQDAIGKYVAEQLNAVERMDISEDLNGSDVVSSPEARDSPPIEQVKVARLAPKIQLKKMKAEAAQLREKEKSLLELRSDGIDINVLENVPASDSITNKPETSATGEEKNKENDDSILIKPSHSVLYPTQEIKPLYAEISEKIKPVTNRKENFKSISKPEEKDIIKTLPKDEIINNKEFVLSDAESVITLSESTVPVVKFPETCVQKTYEDSIEYMNESTASAVDALLSVSREADRVTRVISDDPPEDLFEDDIKDSEIASSDLNGVFNEDNIGNALCENNDMEEETSDEKVEISDEKIEKSDQMLEKSDQMLEKSDKELENSDPDQEQSIQEPETFIQEQEIDEQMNAEQEQVECCTEKEESLKEIDQLKFDFHEPQKEENNVLKFDFHETHKEETEQLKFDFNEPNKAVLENEDNDTITFENTAAIPNEPEITNNDVLECVTENVPSESDLQIAEALITLPSVPIQNKPSSDLQESIPLSLDIGHSQEELVPVSESMVLDDQNSELNENITEKVKTPSTPESFVVSNNENLGVRFETEREKCENLNAAQSLVQMSETIDHKMNIVDAISNKDVPDPSAFKVKQSNNIDTGIKTVEQKIALLSSENNSEPSKSKSNKFETSSSKLLKILEEPCAPKVVANKTPTKQIIMPAKEKILNFDVAKSTFKSKSQTPKQKIIIRRTAPNKNIINNINETSTPDKIILSRSNNPTQDGSSVQTYTIQTSPETPSDANTIIIQQKIRKIGKPPTKLQKLKPQNSLIAPIKEVKAVKETTSADDNMFDINSMPIVLSEDLLTPESIEKMPIVMSDGNIISHTQNPPKLVKTKQTPIESEKVTVSSTPSKPEVKTLLMNPVSEVSKVTTPNILSKSSKLRSSKPMLVIDKNTGKQKIIMTKGDSNVKEVKQTPPLIQSVPQAGKTEKFIILPSQSSPRPGRTQKIVIDPQTGKAHVFVAKGADSPLGASENKPVSAKIVPSTSDASTPGNTVMIITNAQGAQSRIVLTPEHEKILFPNKPNVSQLKTIAHRINTNSGPTPKTVVTAVTSARTQTLVPSKTQTIVPLKTQTIGSVKAQNVPGKSHTIAMSIKAQTATTAKTQTSTIAKPQTITTAKPQTRIVPKQKGAIITSKGQLIMGGRVTSSTHNIAPMPEIRPVPKRIVASEPKKLVQAIQKNTSEPLIFLQQKSGAVMQLTAAQFEHLQRTGQIVQKSPAPVQENKIVVQKSITLSPSESLTPIQKPRARKLVSESPTPTKKVKHEIAIAPAPAPAPITQMPALAPITNTPALSHVPSVSNTVSVPSSTAYSDFDNFEELLPSTAIARQPEPVVTPPQPEPVAAPPAAPLSDALLAVPGEHFGGPPGSFYLCLEDNGTLTPIDNRPLVLENNQLVPMIVEPMPVLAPQPERRDILEAALANSDVFHADTPRDEAPDFRDLNANVSVHCRVSETSTTLNQPIMTPVEMPTKGETEPAVPSNLEDGLAVIGVTPHTVPTSLELPITVTDPRIAPKTTDPLSSTNYGTSLLTSPNTEMTFVTTEESIAGPISMPLLTDDESVGKSMPILTDEVTERTVSSVESTIGSPSSIDVRESETEDGGQWTRRLLTPGSDTSEASTEIPLQPVLQLSVNDLSHHS